MSWARLWFREISHMNWPWKSDNHNISKHETHDHYHQVIIAYETHVKYQNSCHCFMSHELWVFYQPVMSYDPPITKWSRKILVVEAISARWVKDWDADLVQPCHGHLHSRIGKSRKSEDFRSYFYPIHMGISEVFTYMPSYSYGKIRDVDLKTYGKNHRFWSSMWKSHHFVPKKFVPAQKPPRFGARTRPSG